MTNKGITEDVITTIIVNGILAILIFASELIYFIKEKKKNGKEKEDI